jgi:TonB family protein
MKIINLILIAGAVYSINIFPQEGFIKSFYANDTLKSEINYAANVKQGQAKFYYPNGKIKQELNYSDGKVQGVVKEYFDNGNVKEIYTVEDGKRNGSESLFDKDGNYLKDLNYDNGKLVPAEETSENISAQPGEGQNANNNHGQKINSDKLSQLKNEVNKISVPPTAAEAQNAVNSEYLDTADVMPEPVGGLKNIIRKLIYPARAKEKDIEGVVKVLAYIDEYGEVTQDEVISGIGYGCDEAAKITVFYTKFTPGLVKGKPVKVKIVLPLEFKLNKK